MFRESAVPAALDIPTPPSTAADHDAARRLVIESRFGTLAVAAENALTFPRGLLGFEEYRAYALAELSERRYAQFRVLQCLDDHKLAFLVLPLIPRPARSTGAT